jgi:hypothetical protein
MATKKDTIEIDFAPLGENATFSLAIDAGSNPKATWGLDPSLNRTFHFFGTGGSSGPLANLSMTTTTITVTNGGQAQNWSLRVLLSDTDGNNIVTANPSLSGTANITLVDAGGPKPGQPGNAPWDIRLTN